MTSTNTAPGPGPGLRAPLPLLATGALAMATLEMLNPGYDLVSETLSRYVHGTAGWLLPVGLLAAATASAVLAIRLGAGFRRTGRAALLVWTAGLLLAVLFPADPPGHWNRPSPSELVHGNAAFLAFAALPTAAVLLHGTLAARRPGLRTALTTLTAVSVTARRVIEQFAHRPAAPGDTAERLAVLTAWEREVTRLIATGLSNAQIAAQLFVSPLTAKTHVTRAIAKLGVRDRAQLVILAYETA
ncbi:response regulator transcription factor [Streptomyces sp. NPDC051742]|uniref:helix-turn-helix transcriptional regulator n=1 Tax=unclassified Streptomyces TaxID=2593676 RepID=UPI00343B2770